MVTTRLADAVEAVIEELIECQKERDALRAALEEVIHDVEEGAPEHAVSRARTAIKQEKA